METALTVTPWHTLNLDQSAVFIHGAGQERVVSSPIFSVEQVKENLLRIDRPWMVVQAWDGQGLLGWLLVCRTDHDALNLNPGFLGGYPLVRPGLDSRVVGKELLCEAVRWVKERGSSVVSAAVPLLDGARELAEEADFFASAGLLVKLRYVEMICQLDRVPVQRTVMPPEVQLAPLPEVPQGTLYDLYSAAFERGDARFFFTQSELERRDYFDTLGWSEAVQEPASLALFQDGDLIGFGYVLPYGENNRHISCMCVDPDRQGEGLGKLMLAIIQERLHQAGVKTITLGTETEMRAYQLYLQGGFEVLEGTSIYEWRG